MDKIKKRNKEIEILQNKIKDLKNKNSNEKRKRRNKALIQIGILFEKELKSYLNSYDTNYLNINSDEILLDLINKDELSVYFKEYMYAIFRRTKVQYSKEKEIKKEQTIQIEDFIY